MSSCTQYCDPDTCSLTKVVTTIVLLDFIKELNERENKNCIEPSPCVGNTSRTFDVDICLLAMTIFDSSVETWYLNYNI
jgi:hypothetical protein